MVDALTSLVRGTFLSEGALVSKLEEFRSQTVRLQQDARSMRQA